MMESEVIPGLKILCSIKILFRKGAEKDLTVKKENVLHTQA